MKTKLIILVLVLCGLSFAGDKTKTKVAPKDTLIWIQKAEILRYIESQEKELDASKSKLEGQRNLLQLMPDSVQIIQKKQE